MGYYDCRINLDLAVRGAIAFFIYSNFINMPSPMKLEMSRSTVSSTSTLPANEKAAFFSWRTLARVYQTLSMGLLEKVTEEDAKGYTKLLLLLFSAPLIGGLLEGGAL